MNGKIIGVGLIASALIAGAALYYLQVHHFYEPVAAGNVEIRLTGIVSAEPEPIPVEGLEAIDAGSSPIRFRACFTTPLSQALLTETFVLYDRPEPLTAPDWFSCFDATEIGAALEEGHALAFLGEQGIGTGVDRVIAVFDDGRAFAWHQIAPGFAE